MLDNFTFWGFKLNRGDITWIPHLVIYSIQFDLVVYNQRYFHCVYAEDTYYYSESYRQIIKQILLYADEDQLIRRIPHVQRVWEYRSNA